MERVNPTEITLAFDELKVKFRRAYFGTDKVLTKKALSKYLGLKASLLYNPTAFRDTMFIYKVLVVIKNMDITDLGDFISEYKPGIDYKDRFEKFFGKGFERYSI